MQMRYLGGTGIEVSNLCLGAMSLGSLGNADHDSCRRIIDGAIDSGINFIDTADVYSQGESEEIVGAALAGRRDDLVLATKFYNPMSRRPNHRGASRRWIVRACEDSLRRLGTDYIDLYQVHRPDENTDLDETLDALSTLVRDGKVRSVGTSTFPAETIVEAQWLAESRGHVRVRCEQPPYSIFVRGAERDVFPTCRKYGMGAIVWSPLNGGWLTGKYSGGAAAESRFARLGAGAWTLDSPGTDRKHRLVSELEQVAREAGLDLIVMALAFAGSHPAVTSTIIGPRTTAQLDSQLPAADVVLSHDVLDRIDEVVAPGETVSRPDIAYEPRSIRHREQRRRSNHAAMGNR